MLTVERKVFWHLVVVVVVLVISPGEHKISSKCSDCVIQALILEASTNTLTRTYLPVFNSKDS